MLIRQQSLSYVQNVSLEANKFGCAGSVCVNFNVPRKTERSLCEKNCLELFTIFVLENVKVIFLFPNILCFTKS